MNNEDFIISLITRLDLSKTPDDIKKIEKSLNAKGIELKPVLNLATSQKELENFAKQLQSVMASIDPSFEGFNSKQWLSAINNECRQRQRVIDKTNEQIAKIKELNDVKTFKAKFSKAELDFNQLDKSGGVTVDLEKDFSKLKSLWESIGNSPTDKLLHSNVKKFGAQLKLVNNEMSILKNSAKDTSVPLSQIEKMTFAHQVKAWRRINSAAEKDFGPTLDNILIKLDSVDKQGFLGLKSELKEVQTAAKASGMIGKNFSDTISTGAKKFAEWTFSSAIVMNGVQAIKQMFFNVYKLNNALTNINYTMDVSSSQLKKIGTSSFETAKELHTSASNVLDAVKTYANATETAQSIIDKAKPTIMLSNVTGMDTQQTVDILQGTKEQFDLTENELMRISDVFQTVSQNMPYDFAKGVKELSEGIQVSGSAAKDAGYDIERYSSLIGTLIAKTRQSGSELGRSVRTMMLRTTKASTSALANGEVTEEDLSNAEAALRRVGIEIRKDKESFKDFDQTIGELYAKIDTLSEVDLSNLAYELAGIRQSNVFKMMIKSYGDYLNMAEKANNAEGTTLQNQEKYAESLEGKYKGLGATMESVSTNLFKSNDIGYVVDIFQSFANVLDVVTEKIGLFGTASLALGAGLGLKKNSLDYHLEDITHILQGSGKSYCYG